MSLAAKTGGCSVRRLVALRMDDARDEKSNERMRQRAPPHFVIPNGGLVFSPPKLLLRYSFTTSVQST